MSLQVEKLEKSMAKLTVEVSVEQFEKAVTASYNKNKGRFNIPGFRKGKAPQRMIEKMYGAGVFYEGAVDIAIDATYAEALDESGLAVVSQPEIAISQLEQGQPFIYTATFAIKPEVALGDYKGIEVEKAAAEVTDADVEAEIKRVQNQNARLISVEDRAAKEGDQLVIDFDGRVDGEAFEGGKAEAYSLSLGSHSFIDTFEEQLVGKNVGDEVLVNVTFPEEYHAKELAGKPAEFTVVVKEIKVKELPELDDEFASEVSEFDTLEEYREDLKKELLNNKQKQAATENENRVVDKVIANAQLEVPDQMVDYQVTNMVEDYSRRLQGQGIALAQYLEYTNTTQEGLREQMRPQALKQIQTRLVLEAVVKAENIAVDDETVEAEIQTMAENYKMEADKFKEYMGERDRERIKEDLAVQEAVDFLVAESKLV